MDISEVASRARVSTATLRFYERKGLISSSGRSGNRRQFDDSVLERLALIALGQAAGFSLDEIGRMFGPDGEPRIDRDALAARADEIDRAIERLAAMSEGLRHAAACPAPTHMQCPSFRGLLHSAASGALSSPSRPGQLVTRADGAGPVRLAPQAHP